MPRILLQPGLLSDLLCLIAGFFLFLPVCLAEQLPVRTYVTADGLPRDAATHIKQDSRGFIWVVAGDGISRFDGYRFVNYTTDDGLPDRRVNDILETRAGIYWIATESGLCRFNPLGSRSRNPDLGMRTSNLRNPKSEVGGSNISLFVVFNPSDVKIAFNALLEDESGFIWCATADGLYRMDVSKDGSVQFHFIDVGIPAEKGRHRNITALLKDHKGFLWAGTQGGTLYRLAADGRTEHFTNQDGLSKESITALLEDREGSIWVGSRNGLFRLVIDPEQSRPVVAQTYGTSDGLPSNWITELHETREGKFWVTTVQGLCLLVPSDKSKLAFRTYRAQDGICDLQVWDLMEDRHGNLWVASQCGVIKIVRNGFNGYGQTDGLDSLVVNSIFENRNGELFLINGVGGNPRHRGRQINKFDGTRFTSVEPSLPSSVKDFGWGWGQTIIQDHLGAWWIPSGEGLYRFPKIQRLEELARVHPELIRTQSGEKPEPEIFRLYEDSRGDLWIATTGTSRRLLRWERASDSVHDLTQDIGTAPETDFTAFCEDRKGNVWIGTGQGGVLARYQYGPPNPQSTYQSAGSFKTFTAAEGVPPGWIISLYLDRVGRLWIGSQLGGLSHIDDTGADKPEFVSHTTANGLSSNNIRSITEDLKGRIYVGSGHGVDRLDLETGNVKHYTASDGLPTGAVETAYRDRSGALWFGAQFGRVARFVPEQNEPSAPPPIYISGLSVEGVTRQVSELGEMNVPKLELPFDQNDLTIEFVGLAASIGDEISYQYRLEGADDDWSVPTAARTVNFASLAPGTYGFLVRAVNADGQHSLAPASFTFVIRAPVWMRWWFWASFAIIVGLAVYGLYRYRLTRLLEVANVRTRIATDLHDEIGSNLSLIAMLSEIASKKMQSADSQVAGWLSLMANTSRETVDSMSDIVWVVNPDHDRVGDLAERMRRVAADTFAARDIRFRFSASGTGDNLKLGADTRRQVFMIFKEAVNNIARHSQCNHADIELKVENGELDLKLSDDGRGFDVTTVEEGNGLASFRRRAEILGGSLQINSEIGQGTTIRLKVTINGRGSFWRKVNT